MIASNVLDKSPGGANRRCAWFLPEKRSDESIDLAIDRLKANPVGTVWCNLPKPR